MHLPPRNEVQDAYSSHDKVRQVFGERTPYSLEDGLGAHGALGESSTARESSRPFEGIEVTANLPSCGVVESTAQARVGP